ncbi:hypothetical protein [Candidatus Methylomicrobium oryzae]|uniref:hypothetical protein n=1 Tax=Candidatus Methylomicrobium oryzae TaxID=2802053 RepID=UPI001921CA81|nr:hypothetical protein [Methylomicrobium sp. RS1]MBL1266008.1 hypothetical protein [Methylomicrobium sp. RS1]
MAFPMIRDFQQLDRLDHFQQYLLTGQHQYVLDAVQSMPADDLVSIWLRMHLRQDLPESIELALPPSFVEQWRGWRAYYIGDYCRAAEHFLLAWQTVNADCCLTRQADVALGLGKVYTRTGHWRTAREWLLTSLALGRQQNRLFDIVQGYGALGELLLRSGHPQAAFTCLSNAYHLLPPGSGQRPRQLNYLASALLRCGETLRAESLLMTSLHLAHDSHDDESVWHALARLQFLVLDNSRVPKDHSEDVTETLKEYVPTAKINPIALGFLHMGHALLAYRHDNRVDALSKIQLAKSLFGLQFPYEHCWALQWEAFLTDKPGVNDIVTQELLQLCAVSPKMPQIVLDSSWQCLHLPDENGFTPLTRNVHDVESLTAARYLFFI